MSRPLDPRLIRLVPALRATLAAIAGLQVVGAVLTVAQVWVVADVIVGVMHRHFDRISPDVVALLLIGVLRALLAAAQELVSSRASVRVRSQLRQAVLAAALRPDLTFAADRDANHADVTATVAVESIDGYVSRAVPAVVSACVVPPVILLGIGLADWQCLLVLLGILPLVPLFMVLVGVMTKSRMDRQYRTLERIAGQFLDLVRGLTTLKIYGQAQRQVDSVRRATETYRRHTMAALRMAFLSGFVLDLLATLSVAVVAVDVGLRLDHGHVGLAPALVALFLAPEVFGPIRAMGAQHHAAQAGQVAIDAICGAIGSDEPEVAPTGAVEAEVAGALVLDRVTVRYAERSRPALDGVSLTIEPRSTMVITGRSGAGKSTLLACLLRLVSPQDGGLRLGTAADADRGEQAFEDLDVTAWRDHVAWLPQRPLLAAPTVAEAVAAGDREAPSDTVAAAIALCRAPAADTTLGENGAAISSGERRRVALARALLRVWRQIDRGDVPLLVLDEPTEDLDPATEQAVLAVVASLAGEATIVISSHSVRVLRLADRHIELDDGRIVADRTGELAGRLEAETVRPAASVHSAASVRPAASARPTEPVQPAAPNPAAANESRTVDLVGLRGLRRWVAAAGALSGLTGLAGLALTATSIWLICRASQHPNIQALAIAVVAVRTFALARALLRYAERLVSHDGALRLLANVRARVFASLEPLVPFASTELRRGDLLRRFVVDIDGVQEGFVRAVVPLVGATVTALGAVVVAWAFVPMAGLALSVGVLGGLIVAPVLAARIAGPAHEAADLSGQRDALSTAITDGAAEIVAYGGRGAALADVAQLEDRIRARSDRAAVGSALGVAVTGSCAAAALAATLAIASTAVRHGALAPVDAGVLVACVLVAFDALAPLPSAFAAWARFRAGYDRVADILARRPAFAAGSAHVDGSANDAGEHRDVELVLRDATIAPAAGAPPVIRHGDLDVGRGHRVALTGPSGCGKSTLLASLLRLVPLRAGTLDVIVGDRVVPMVELCATDVPPLIAGSLQGDHVFDTSLRDNLRVVRRTATDAELDEVAARAGLRDFVGSVPLGWDTPAGADGALLSGGQRQRLLIARALLADPAVLVLDEPTAHLDAETERAVLDDLFDATRGRTVVLSTHRDTAGLAQLDVTRLGVRPGVGCEVRLEPARSDVARSEAARR